MSGAMVIYVRYKIKFVYGALGKTSSNKPAHDKTSIGTWLKMNSPEQWYYPVIDPRHQKPSKFMRKQRRISAVHPRSTFLFQRFAIRISLFSVFENIFFGLPGRLSDLGMFPRDRSRICVDSSDY